LRFKLAWAQWLTTGGRGSERDDRRDGRLLEFGSRRDKYEDLPSNELAQPRDYVSGIGIRDLKSKDSRLCFIGSIFRSNPIAQNLGVKAKDHFPRFQLRDFGARRLSNLCDNGLAIP
jgi:hypothetical protein